MVVYFDTDWKYATYTQSRKEAARGIYKARMSLSSILCPLRKG